MEYKDIQYLKGCFNKAIPSVFDPALSYDEQIRRCIYAVNQLIENDAYFKETLDNFINEVNENLENIVINTLNEWLNSGKISLIFNKLFNTFIDASNANLKTGDIFTTCGFYEKNDGGNATYEVSENGIINYNNLKANVVNFIVNPIMYGAKGDGKNDDTLYFQNCINDSYGRKKIELIKKYSLKKIEITNYIKINFNNSELIANANTATDIFLNINIEYEDENNWNDNFINGININGNDNSNYNKLLNINARSLNINNIFLKKCSNKDSAIYIQNYDGVMINNITCHSSIISQGNIGVRIYRSDTYYNNIEVSNFYCNVQLDTSNNIIINNLHSWHLENETIAGKYGVQFTNGPGNFINNFITDGDSVAINILSQDNGTPLKITKFHVFTPSKINTLINCTKYEQLQNIKIGTLSNFRDGTKLTNIIEERQLLSINDFSNNMRFGLKATILGKEITLYQYNSFLIINGLGTHQLTYNFESSTSSLNIGTIENLLFPPLDTNVGSVDVYGANSYDLKSTGYLYIDMQGNLIMKLIKSLGVGEHIILIKNLIIPLLTY